MTTPLEQATQLIDSNDELYGDLAFEQPPRFESANIPSAKDDQTISTQLMQILQDYKAQTCSEAQVAATLETMGKQAAETQEYSEELGKAKLLQDCIGNGCNFPLRDHPIGRLWDKALKNDADMKARYTPLKTREAKANMRAEWVKETFAQMSRGKTWTKTWQKIDTNKGKYLNFGLLVESFGIMYDRRAAVIAATKHADKCMKMKGDWVRFDKMGEVAEFLKLNREFTEDMTEAWSLWTSEHDGDASAGPAVGPSVGAQGGEQGVGTNPSGHNDKAGSSKGQPEQGMKRTREAEGGNTKLEKKDSKKGKQASKKNQELERALAEAAQTKKLHSTAMSRAENLVTLIDASSEWGWARTPESLGALREMTLKLKGQISEDPEMSKFILEDIKDLRRDIGADALLAMASEFNKLKPILETIDAKQQSLVQGHKSLAKR